MFVLLIFVGFYAYYKGQKEAKYYTIGWSFMLFSISMLPLTKLGFVHLPIPQIELFRIAFFIEIFLFSIALAHRVKILNDKHQVTQAKLLELQQIKEQKLQVLVEEKTQDITTLLQQKEILFQELNHRVKNNLQMILSLLKLQIEKTPSLLTKEALQTTRNRIGSIANLYENLHLESNSYKSDTLAYFTSIISNISSLHHKAVEVDYQIHHQLNENQLFYAGLILNELATNAYKYAFVEKGVLSITLEKQEKNILMLVEDNGIGFTQKSQNALGLTIVTTLIEKQLLGTMNIYSTARGTKILLNWEEDE